MDNLILNKTQLTEMSELLGDNFSMLLDIFLRDSKLQVEKISEWENSTQNSSALMAAHTLKSSAANLGLDQLAAQCDVIEVSCREEQINDLPSIISALAPIYENSISELKISCALETESA